MTAAQPTASARRALNPLDGAATWLLPGFWQDKVRVNEASLWHAYGELERAGNFVYLRAAAAGVPEPPSVPPLNDTFVYRIFDSDVYKWLEGVAWHASRGGAQELVEKASTAVDLITAAQRPDGYVHTWIQTHAAESPWAEWGDGTELYCGGHLIQAGIAWHRALGEDRLLTVARRFADHLCIVAEISEREMTPPHPGLESALIELFRATESRRYLDLGVALLDRRGYGFLRGWKFSPDYWSDDVPVRAARTIRGHAVMALYLLAGMVDAYTETGDEALLDAARAQFADMTASKMYLTGRVGSRHHGEAFGDAFELSPDRAYCETCASVAVVMAAWRLLLATGDMSYGDVIERELYNGVLAGVSLDGRAFFYANPLQRREPRFQVMSSFPYERQPWFECACCPPNLMRLLASLEQLVATRSPDGIEVHQLISSSVATSAPDGVGVTVTLHSDLPWGQRPRRDRRGS